MVIFKGTAQSTNAMDRSSAVVHRFSALLEQVTRTEHRVVRTWCAQDGAIPRKVYYILQARLEKVAHELLSELVAVNIGAALAIPVASHSLMFLFCTFFFSKRSVTN
jgi:hypothetical protein